MKKQLLALAGIAVLFAACSKKEDAPSENPTTGLLKGMYSITDTTRIEYNNDKTVSKIAYGYIDGTDVGGGITTVKYANSKVSEIWETTYAESKVFGPNELLAQFVYVDNKIQKIINPGKATDYLYYDSARYNASGKLEKVFRYGGLKPNVTKGSTDSIVWTGNNITKVVHEGFYTDNGVEKLSYTYTDTYTFDDKPSWQAPLGAATMDGGFAPEAFNTNNILTQTRVQAGQADRTNTYVYVYDEKNKVIKRTATFLFDQSPGTEVAVFEYYQ
ncbi:hypothetical protein HHL17_32965 [Chitinophaga sp. G-6-1-13]|uniref:DUF4595 domain-containing protein n=1 Tax=Chitinophaga fulva TaxID=2728842 RepID=A0A848GUK9_9BACT|nr:hypothetical protein [Chitinophaga fulva]NML42044.1 hypothetical protein [Chitinophaga fulva]